MRKLTKPLIAEMLSKPRLMQRFHHDSFRAWEARPRRHLSPEMLDYANSILAEHLNSGFLVLDNSGGYRINAKDAPKLPSCVRTNDRRKLRVGTADIISLIGTAPFTAKALFDKLIKLQPQWTLRLLVARLDLLCRSKAGRLLSELRPNGDIEYTVVPPAAKPLPPVTGTFRVKVHPPQRPLALLPCVPGPAVSYGPLCEPCSPAVPPSQTVINDVVKLVSDDITTMDNVAIVHDVIKKLLSIAPSDAAAAARLILEVL